MSKQKEDLSPVYAGVGGGVSVFIVIAILVVVILFYLKRR